MEERKSSLPFAEVEEIIKRETMTITTLSLRDCPMRRVTLNIDADGEPLTVSLHTIDNDKVRGYLPSKAWYDGAVELLYYVCPSMPAAARPFGDKPVYCFTTSLAGRDITYDAGWRVFIDQLATPTGMLLMVMFSADQYEHIVHKEMCINHK